MNGSDLPKSKIGVSFEFFPPKTEAMEKTLWNSIRTLEPIGPSFVSVTYGAGGSTRERTHNTVRRIQDETGLTAAAHLTCVSATKEEIDEIIRSYWNAGIRHIVALRGDPPEGVGTKYRVYPGGYVNSADLTSGIKRIADFEVSVGTYPEKHPESPSLNADIELLKEKVDAGATRAITQFVFDSEIIARFRDKVSESGLDVPIVPGIFPINNFVGARRFAEKAGASVPKWLDELFSNLDDDPEVKKAVAVKVAADQCFKLRDYGFSQFHFYTLNRAALTREVCRILGLDVGNGKAYCADVEREAAAAKGNRT